MIFYSLSFVPLLFPFFRLSQKDSSGNPINEFSCNCYGLGTEHVCTVELRQDVQLESRVGTLNTNGDALTAETIGARGMGLVTNGT